MRIDVSRLKLAGIGRYAKVYFHHDPDKVVRVWGSDPAYEMYLGVIAGKANAHAPVLHKITTTTDGLKAAILDKCIPTDKFFNGGRDCFGKLNGYSDDMDALISIINNLVSSSDGKIVLDLSKQNVMYSKAFEPVITDPVAAGKYIHRDAKGKVIGVFDHPPNEVELCQ